MANLKLASKLFGTSFKSEKQLIEWIDSNYDEDNDDLAYCPVCENTIPDFTPDGKEILVCVFCNANFNPDGEDEEVYEEVHVMDELKPDALFEEEEVEEEEVEEEEVEEEEVELEDEEEPEEDDGLEVDEDYEDLAEELPKEESPPKTKKEKKNEKNTMANSKVDNKKNNKKDTKITPAKKRGSTKEIVPVETTESPLNLSPAQMKELEESIKRVKDLKQKFTLNNYDLGLEIAKISESTLWKAKYPTFNDFCEKELEISRSLAYKFMNTSALYTREEFAVLGIKKADLLSRLPEKKREELLDKTIKEGLSFSKLKEEVDSFKGKKDKEESKERKEKKEKVEKNKEESTTLLAKVTDEEFVVEWMSAATHEPVIDSDEEKYAVITLSDEVELIIIDNKMSITCSYRKV